MEALKRFLRDEGGLETIEWAFILGFVTLGAVLVFVSAGGHMTTVFSELTSKLSTAASEAAGVCSVVVASINIQADTLNLQSMGKWITSYVELPQGYDVGDIVVSSVMLNGQVRAQQNPTRIGDYDSDGVADLMVKFDRSAVQGTVQVGDAVALTVTGRLTDGTTFKGRDTIVVQ